MDKLETNCTRTTDRLWTTYDQTTDMSDTLQEHWIYCIQSVNRLHIDSGQAVDSDRRMDVRSCVRVCVHTCSNTSTHLPVYIHIHTNKNPQPQLHQQKHPLLLAVRVPYTNSNTTRTCPESPPSTRHRVPRTCNVTVTSPLVDI